MRLLNTPSRGIEIVHTFQHMSSGEWHASPEAGRSYEHGLRGAALVRACTMSVSSPHSYYYAADLACEIRRGLTLNVFVHNLPVPPVSVRVGPLVSIFVMIVPALAALGPRRGVPTRAASVVGSVVIRPSPRIVAPMVRSPARPIARPLAPSTPAVPTVLALSAMPLAVVSGVP